MTSNQLYQSSSSDCNNQQQQNQQQTSKRTMVGNSSNSNNNSNSSNVEKSTENPFVHFISPKLSHWVKIYIVSIFILPIRLLLIGLMFGLAYIIATAAVYGVTCEDSLLSGWRRKCRKMVAKCVLIGHHFAGFFPIRTKGVRAPSEEAPILVIAPHTTYFDILPYVFLEAPSLVCKMSLMNAPCIGRLLQVTCPILVNRDDPNSRRHTMEAIQARAKVISERSGRENCPPQMAIFPEATCTNGKSLVTFKPGAFTPRLPVQPVCLRWRAVPVDTFSWTWESTDPLKLLWWSLCNLRNFLEVEFLPVYHPSDEEKADPELYAHNVRAVMAKSLQMPVSDYSVDDAYYYTSYIAPSLERFESLCSKLGLSSTNHFHRITKRTEHFRRSLRCVLEKLNQRSESESRDVAQTCDSLDESRDESFCYFDLPSFAEFCGISQDDPGIHRLFNMFDWEMKRVIDIREFILTVWSAEGCHKEDFLDIAFSFFATDDRICECDFVKILRFPYQQSTGALRKAFARADDTEKTGRLSFESVQATIAEIRQKPSRKSKK